MRGFWSNIKVHGLTRIFLEVVWWCYNARVEIERVWWITWGRNNIMQIVHNKNMSYDPCELSSINRNIV